MDSSNLLSEVGPADLDHSELLRVLQDHYRVSSASGRDVLEFPAGAQHQLRVRLENGRIRSILKGPDFDAEDFKGLIALVRERIVDSPGSVVGREILMASLPIGNGMAFPALDLQISPPPDNAPRPGVIYAEHPFVLEFRMPRGGDGFITNQRRLATATEWGLVLNALLRLQVRVPTPRASHYWAYRPEENRSEWLQELYFVDGWSAYAEDFQPAPSPFQTVDHSEYYESDIRPGAERDEVILPKSLPDLLSNFARLEPTSRQLYLRAATWIQISDRVWETSPSSWFRSRVSAIETFVQADASDVCDQCGSVVGVTKAFRATLEQYAPRLDKKTLTWRHAVAAG